MTTTRKTPAARGSWASYHAGEIAAVERMGRAAKRRYLERRLHEVENMIEAVLLQQEVDLSPPSLWDVTSQDSDFWHDAMDLNYLEASRHAILQTLAALSRPA